MSHDLLGYNEMVERAMRSVVRQALNHAAEQGLPGNHHFYVTFSTDHPDIVLPDILREQYPHEMTIVLQHQFWGLETDEDGFEVTLSFNKRQERLRSLKREVLAQLFALRVEVQEQTQKTRGPKPSMRELWERREEGAR